MKPTPNRDAAQWAAFNSRFHSLLTWVPTVCFWVVVGGSVYGIHKSIQAQYPQSGLFLAFWVALGLQFINSASVHYSTRWISSWFTSKYNKQNKHQLVDGVDGWIGFFCLCFTAGLCYFDFIANQQASEYAANLAIARPDTERVDTTAHAAAVASARTAVAAQQSAEAAERRHYEARVDADIARKGGGLRKRRAQLLATNPLPKWAAAEVRQIDRQLTALESERQQRRAAFEPKKSDVASAQTALANVSAQGASLLLARSAEADSINTTRRVHYESKRDGAAGGLFAVYVIAMLLWHLCEGLRHHRALRFDESQPNKDNAFVAILATLRDGLSNLLWMGQAKLLYWMPETEIHSFGRADLLAKTNTAVCRDAFQYIAQNPGINEMLIYTGLRDRYAVDDVRQALRLLKTVRLAHENSHCWTADVAQAAFFEPAPAAAATPGF